LGRGVWVGGWGGVGGGGGVKGEVVLRARGKGVRCWRGGTERGAPGVTGVGRNNRDSGRINP